MLLALSRLNSFCSRSPWFMSATKPSRSLLICMRCHLTGVYLVAVSVYLCMCKIERTYERLFFFCVFCMMVYSGGTQQSKAPRQLISTFMTYFKNTLGLICAFHLTFCYLAKYQIRARRLNRRLWFLCACYFNWDITTMSVSYERWRELKQWANASAT